MYENSMINNNKYRNRSKNDDIVSLHVKRIRKRPDKQTIQYNTIQYNTLKQANKQQNITHLN